MPAIAIQRAYVLSLPSLAFFFMFSMNPIFASTLFHRPLVVLIPKQTLKINSTPQTRQSAEIPNGTTSKLGSTPIWWTTNRGGARIISIYYIPVQLVAVVHIHGICVSESYTVLAGSIPKELRCWLFPFSALLHSRFCFTPPFLRRNRRQRLGQLTVTIRRNIFI